MSAPDAALSSLRVAAPAREVGPRDANPPALRFSKHPVFDEAS